MRAWLITIVMHDGSHGQHHGLYTDGCAAVMRAMELFPNAACISARCVGGAAAQRSAA